MYNYIHKIEQDSMLLLTVVWCLSVDNVLDTIVLYNRVQYNVDRHHNFDSVLVELSGWHRSFYYSLIKLN